MIFFQPLGGCLVSISKQQFSVFKQHLTYFHTFFHPHVFPQKFLNNNFQFLNTCTKQALDLLEIYNVKKEFICVCVYIYIYIYHFLHRRYVGNLMAKILINIASFMFLSLIYYKLILSFILSLAYPI